MPMHVVLPCHRGLLLDSYDTLMQAKVWTDPPMLSLNSG